MLGSSLTHLLQRFLHLLEMRLLMKAGGYNLGSQCLEHIRKEEERKAAEYAAQSHIDFVHGAVIALAPRKASQEQRHHHHDAHKPRQRLLHTSKRTTGMSGRCQISVYGRKAESRLLGCIADCRACFLMACGAKHTWDSRVHHRLGSAGRGTEIGASLQQDKPCQLSNSSVQPMTLAAEVVYPNPICVVDCLCCEEGKFHHHHQQMHQDSRRPIDRHKPSKEEAPAPGLQSS